MTAFARDAKALLGVKLGDGQPLVPAEARSQGASTVIAAALRRLAAPKRPTAPVIHRRAPEHGEPEKQHSRWVVGQFALRVTPAMAAGVTERLWEVSDIVALVEAKEAAEAPKVRGPYRKRVVSGR